jgi:glutamate synthase (NADPH/NADH) large chain
MILADWPKYRGRFVKVFPHEYRRALKEMATAAVASKQKETA